MSENQTRPSRPVSESDLGRPIPSRCDVCWSEDRPLKRFYSAAGSVGYCCTDDHACAEDWSRMVRVKGGKRLRRRDQPAPSDQSQPGG